ncbi:2-ketovalerate ferredoxin oxidoreductase beta-2 [Thermococcus onnurineus NA1]|uniref:2-ketovalerate ferredoxin oxidoreductase beta-2 n=1 Tax=Thermococcus onnurineus (strain NA1) TaxID=523850 RepID=B6YY06_THEON|nr:MULTISPECIES: 3-methyl-2-oxobutanoate dehydrogenase subunit beta [Thermococcus]ACJ16969.1 2-ketovalerate ferredoxin oxidoreductase beta-2 [Thermococcus onnurineus NA1]NJE46693.1 3-methyl-2-oxobutanoate dehydrogenase subunit beta [Thermococcus sp. GR7]NJE77879.1 3-methyl-2-oxobutanoate dehydrogenase subunit beta [Thermococcus sp. GR4]NJF23007.1 3-methyl-2-oxobutanoate dehydrogenase subunit beta [Thermococcus sp. GR5]
MEIPENVKKRLSIPAEEHFYAGHTACQGCGASLGLRYVLKAYGKKTIFAIPACCSTIIAGPWPYSALDANLFHTAFETTGAVISGIEAALKAKGYKVKGEDGIMVVGWAGDGGTADIGLQALSGFLERGHDAVYIMYDNEAYMNTGIQRSGSTPYGAWTTNTPGGKEHFLEKRHKKKVIDIVIAHEIPYAATASVAYPEDFIRKLKKAQKTPGPSFIQLFAPCPTGWRSPTDKSIELARLAVQTAYFPLFEYENGKYKINMPSTKKDPKPIEEFLKLQGRFKYMTKEDIDILQQWVLHEWEKLKKLAEIFG